MPIYEYQCKACQHQFDTIQSFSEDPLVECPACHKPELHKLISAPAFQLKGSGWYVTDFKNAGKKTANTEKTEVADSKVASKETASSQTDNKSSTDKTSTD